MIKRGTPFKANNQNIYVKPFSAFLTPIPSTKVYSVINTAVDNAKKKAALLNFIFEENEIKNKPRQTIIMPPKPYVFIEVDKNIILKRAIKSDEPPLAIG